MDSITDFFMEKTKNKRNKYIIKYVLITISFIYIYIFDKVIDDNSFINILILDPSDTYLFTFPIFFLFTPTGRRLECNEI